jgi:putative ABC transport system permease protein
VRRGTSHVNDVDNLPAAAANPQNPSEVDVSRPSDDLFLGLGAVSLLVGAVGVALLR